MSTKKSPFDNVEPIPDRTQESVFGIPATTIYNAGVTLQAEQRTIIVPAGSEVIIFNKQFSSALLNELDEITNSLLSLKPVTSQDDVIAINAVLKTASRFIKKFDEQRKAMGEELTKYKDSLLVEQKSILSKIVDFVEAKNNEIVIFQKAQAKLQAEREAEIKKQRDAEIAAAQKENLRKQNILNLIHQFETNTLNAIASATIDNIDERTTTFGNFKLRTETYQEYMPQAEQLYKDLTFKFLYRKEELVNLAELEKTNKLQAEQLRLQQEQQAEADRKASAERIAQQASDADEQAQSDIANTQMQAELRTSVLPSAKNVMKRWTFDLDKIDIAALPVEYHMPDASKIKSAIAAGAREIPGVYIYEEISNVKR